MKNFLIRVAGFISNRKGIILLGLLVITLGFPHLADAAGEATTEETTEQAIATMLSMGIQFLNMLLWPFLLIIGDLMDTQIILGAGMEDRLLQIWVQVRNLVNIAFVLVLLFVALYNVMGFGGGEGELAIKTALPKVILGLVLVNFTFVGGKVVLDLVNVATTAVFALPEMAGADDYSFSGVKDEFMRNVCLYHYDEKDPGNEDKWEYWDEDSGEPIHTQLLCEVEDGQYKKLNGLLEAKYFTDLNANNIGLVMAVNMGSLTSLNLLKADAMDGFGTLSISFLFSLFMYLVFAISYIVLGIVLLVRIVILWIALALSPIAVLVYVVPQVKEWAGSGGDLAQKVIKTLVAPIVIGLAMSLGYLMMSAWHDVSQNATLAFSNMKVDEVISTKFLIAGINDLPQFIIALTSVVIVWVGVFGAASGTFAEFATNAIKELGETVGKAAGKAPLLLPTVPVLSTQGEQNVRMSPLAMWEGANSTADYFGSGAVAQKQWDSYLKTNPALGALLGDAPRHTTPIQASNDLADIRGDKTAYSKEEIQQMAVIMSNAVRSNSKASDSEKKEIMAALEQIKGNGDIEELKKIVGKYEAEDLGMPESLWKEHKEAIERAQREVPTATPAAGTTIETSAGASTGATGTASADPVAAAVTKAKGSASAADIEAAATALSAAGSTSTVQTQAKELMPVAQKAADDLLTAAKAAATLDQAKIDEVKNAATSADKIAKATGDTAMQTAATTTLTAANALVVKP